MTIAVKFGDLSDPKQLSGFIFLDAVTSYSKAFDGRVTEHPVETGVSISDHFKSENPKFKIKGVISGVDLSPIPSTIILDGKFPLNANTPPTPVNINDMSSGLKRFLPDSISQFIPNTPPIVEVGAPRQDYKQDVETLLETLMNGIFFNEDRNRWENRMTISTIYEVEGSQLGRSYTNCVMTSYRVSEDVESGEGLFLELSFEQVRFATSERAEAPAPKKGSQEARGTSPTKDKGTVPTKTPTETQQPKNDRAFSTD